MNDVRHEYYNAINMFHSKHFVKEQGFIMFWFRNWAVPSVSKKVGNVNKTEMTDDCLNCIGRDLLSEPNW